MKRIYLLFLLVILFSVSTGCAYMKDRLRDFSDIFILEASVGPGLGVHIEATRFLGTMVGFGVIDTYPIKFRDKDFVPEKLGSEGFSDMLCVGLGVCSFVGETDYMYLQYAGLVNWHTLKWLDYESKEVLPWALDTSVHVHAGYFGLRIGISPTELADFLLGFTTYDIMQDDGQKPPAVARLASEYEGLSLDELTDMLSSKERKKRVAALICLLEKGERAKKTLLAKFPEDEDEWEYLFKEWPRRRYWLNPLEYLPFFGVDEPAPEILYATKRHFARTVELLVEWGVDLNINSKCSGSDYTALHAAAERGYAEIVEVLCDGGADMNVMDGSWHWEKKGRTPLQVAIARKKTEVVKVLIEKGADLNMVAEGEWRPLDYAINHDADNIAIMLIEEDVELNYRSGRDGWTPLTLAAGKYKFSIVKALVEGGAHVNYGNHKGKKVIHLAAKRSSMGPEMCEYLVSKGADVNCTDYEGRTPLHDLAADTGGLNHDLERRTAKFLIDNGADVNAKIKDGTTPLHEAAGISNIWKVKPLVENGADVNARTKNGITPIHLAVNSKYNYHPDSRLNITKLLIEKGADINLSDGNGKTALDIAIERGYTKITSLLRANGGKRGAKLKAEKEKQK
ncbi:MAG: hypothetical protein E3J72_04525 [Planctomycetota bacterium]|nr:MAG: hypothetical protein E3J72_04525 [Planctomycetota bacterium]